MQKGPKIALAVSAAMVLLAGVRVGLIYRANHEVQPARADPYADVKINPDENVFLKKEYPDSLADQRSLIGQTVWISAGGQLAYYVNQNNRVNYAKPVGNLPGATALLIKGVFEEKAPATGPAVFRIPAGERQVLLAFTLPKSSDPATLYATPVGDFNNGSYTFVNDQVFFYDNPQKLYSFWGPAIWSDIEQHKVVAGMSEDQVMMSLGEVMQPNSDDSGNRTVVYDNDGHPITITFMNDKAVTITPGK